MAEHLRHQFARGRSEVDVRPNAVDTLAHFLDKWSPAAEAPAGFVHLLVERALERQRPARFRESAEFPGFVRALAALFAEAPAANLPDDVARIFAFVAQELEGRGMAARHVRVLAAATAVTGAGALPKQIVLDGFFKFSAPETALLLALARRTEVVITLPDAPQVFLDAGFAELRCETPGRKPAQTAFTAVNMERETEEIARRILAHAAAGRPFREMGIVLRVREPYGPLLETTLARCGIPARFYFTDPLGAHPVVAYLSALVRAHLADWDHEQLLSALRMPASGLGATPAGDDFDFAMRKLLPGRGQPVAGLSFPWPDLNGRDRLEPAMWAARLRQLRSVVPPPDVTDRVSRDQVYVWRSTSAALVAFEEALDGAALALAGASKITLAPFWKQVETELATRSLRVPDARRNVVHVMDAYEARQWELPVVFVCGLTDRHFPQHHREDAIIGDAARRRAGIETAADREREEKFLFELAVSRATAETVLSYSTDSGTACVFPIPEAGEAPDRSLWSRLRIGVPSSCGAPPSTPLTVLNTLSASAIESYLQCPFKFFAGRILRLRERPPAPRDRLDVRLQGTILHSALASWARAPLLGLHHLDQAFAEECVKARVPVTYRTEAVRLELRRHFSDFLDSPEAALTASDIRVEEKFNFALNPALSINGRIDRVDLDSAGRAIVIDYKYSAAGQIKGKIDASNDGSNVQGGLYLLAAERALGLKARGMYFCGVKKGVTWEGWEDPAEVADLMRIAEQSALRVHEAALGGRFPVQPTDRAKCRWCDYRDTCRVESISRPLTAQVGE